MNNTYLQIWKTGKNQFICVRAPHTHTYTANSSLCETIFQDSNIVKLNLIWAMEMWNAYTLPIDVVFDNGSTQAHKIQQHDTLDSIPKRLHVYICVKRQQQIWYHKRYDTLCVQMCIAAVRIYIYDIYGRYVWVYAEYAVVYRSYLFFV